MQSPSASTRFTLLPTNYLASQPPSSEITLQSLIDTSDRLAEEAREALPYNFDECAYDKGYLRQSVWSCLDCGEKGVCYGCSISCHAEHRLTELWTRRHFRCDCPTVSTQPAPVPTPSAPQAKRRRCTLYPPQSQPQEANEENRYTQNFKGKFCRCGRAYDAETETEAMICCMGCEDWFHESCLNLNATPSLPLNTAQPNTSVTPSTSSSTSTDTKAAPPIKTAAADTAVEITSTNERAGLPANPTPVVDEDDDDEAAVLIPSDSYDGLICSACMKSNAYLRSQAGEEGWMIIEPTASGTFEVIGQEVKPDSSEKQKSESSEPRVANGITVGDQGSNGNGKRTSVQDGAESSSKRLKLENDAAPVDVSKKEDVSEGEITVLKSGEASNADGKVEWKWRGKGDIFLADGIRERLKSTLDAETIASLPFPLEDEEIYEPPKDDDQEETMEQVTTRVMGQLPRVQAIEALHGYQRLKDRLNEMLQSHVAAGTTVSKEHIEDLFAQLRGANRS